MAAFALAEPRAKRPCTTAVTLYPLQGAANLRERYTEDTADVFFVGGETKEKLPAHREVLKVASAVFFTMFGGNWKEERENKILAPEKYKWESFKAAIALLYGEEVEVEKSSIPDVYRVAHLYDFTGVISILAQQVCQWGIDLLGTVVKLCAFAESVPEGKNNLLNVTVEYIARHVDEVSPSDVVHFSYKAMEMLVKSEAITCAELVLLRTLNQWTNAQEDITLRQTKQLYSHIRFGTIPYKDLAECSVVGHDHLKLALQNHQKLSVYWLSRNLVQITPRLSQKEVFQVYPMNEGIRAVAQYDGTIEIANVSCSDTVGVLYCGKQEIKFQLDLTMKASSLKCRLCTVHNYSPDTRQEQNALEETLSLSCPHEHAKRVYNSQMTTTVRFQKCTVVLNRTSAHIMLQSAALPCRGTACAIKEMKLSCFDDFPRLLTFGVSGGSSEHFIIHPPTL